MTDQEWEIWEKGFKQGALVVLGYFVLLFLMVFLTFLL